MALASCRHKNNGEELLTYKLLEINSSNVSIPNSYSASIKGKQDIKIIPNVSGYLDKVCINEGRRVKKGQVLLINEPSQTIERNSFVEEQTFGLDLNESISIEALSNRPDGQTVRAE